MNRNHSVDSEVYEQIKGGGQQRTQGAFHQNSSAEPHGDEILEDFTEDAPSLYGFHEVGVAERPGLARVGTNISTMSSKSTDPAFEVDFEEDDPENPRNMSMWAKSWAIFSCAFATTSV